MDCNLGFIGQVTSEQIQGGSSHDNQPSADAGQGIHKCGLDRDFVHFHRAKGPAKEPKPPYCSAETYPSAANPLRLCTLSRSRGQLLVHGSHLFTEPHRKNVLIVRAHAQSMCPVQAPVLLRNTQCVLPLPQPLYTGRDEGSLPPAHPDTGCPKRRHAKELLPCADESIPRRTGV